MAFAELDWQNPENWHDPSISQFLQNAKIVKMEDMRSFLKRRGKHAEFTNKVFFVTLEGGKQAVLKMNDSDNAKAEVAAYNASVLLGFPYVPPIVLRTINGKVGTLQLFVDTDIDLFDPVQCQQVMAAIDPQEFDKLKLFYFVFGQWDSGEGNMLALKTKNGCMHLIAIDNERISGHQYVEKYGELPFVEREPLVAIDNENITNHGKSNINEEPQAFPFHECKIIEPPIVPSLRKEFGDRLPESFYNDFKYKQKMRVVVYRNSLWVQYHAFDDTFVRSYVENCGAQVLASLRKIDLQALKKVFSVAAGAEFLNDRYYQNILNRKQMVLDFFCK